MSVFRRSTVDIQNNQGCLHFPVAVAFFLLIQKTLLRHNKTIVKELFILYVIVIQHGFYIFDYKTRGYLAFTVTSQAISQDKYFFISRLGKAYVILVMLSVSLIGKNMRNPSCTYTIFSSYTEKFLAQINNPYKTDYIKL